jgi:peroxiredoxin
MFEPKENCTFAPPKIMRTMKKTSWMILAAAALLAACSNKNTFTIEGHIDGAQDSVLYLHHMGVTKAEVIDSVKLDESGDFCFEEAAPQAPDFYVLRIANQIVNLSIDSTETVSVKAKYPGMATNYEVEGSVNCQKIKELALKQQALQERIIALDRNLSMGQQWAADSLEHMINAYKEEVKKDYIFQAPNEAYAYFALFQSVGIWNIFDKSNPQDLKVFGAVATSWETFYPESERTKNLRSMTLKSMNDNRQAVARQQRALNSDIVVESGVVDLSLPDKNGKTRTLTELKGKVVLLDFHSFGLKDSAARILALRDLYNKYHAQGLEIYQVSFDGDKHFWRQSVDALPWISVYDSNGTSVVRYNVQEVPEFFLIDRQNQLQKRSVQIKDLEAEISKML